MRLNRGRARSQEEERRRRQRGPRPAPPKMRGKIEVWDKGPDGKARVRQVELP